MLLSGVLVGAFAVDFGVLGFDLRLVIRFGLWSDLLIGCL